jgi:glycosyltransferase involved in cell wall biosynthesis
MTHSEPRVSVVIPTYNRAGLLGLALDSVYAQTWKRFEVIVIDDGSTDGTEAALRPYVERRGLRVLRQENRGPSAARNRGIEAARGEYIAFLDSDDLWLPIKLAVQVARLDACPGAVMCYSNMLHFDPDTQTLSTRYRPQAVRSGDLYRALIYKKLHCAPPTLVVRKAVAERVSGFDESLRLSEDRDFNIRVARHGPILGIPAPLVVVRVHGAAHPKDLSVRLSHEAMQAAQEYVLRKTLAEDPSLRGIAGRVSALYHLGWGLGLLSRRRPRSARREFLYSIRANPLQLRAYAGYARSLLTMPEAPSEPRRSNRIAAKGSLR